MKDRLQDKVVIVTGGTAGIGKTAVQMMVAEGAKVVFCARKTEAGQTLEAQINAAGGEAVFLRADVAAKADNEMLVRETLERYGRVDGIVCNAGLSWYQPFHEIAEKDWHALIATNLDAVFYLLKAALPQMIKQQDGSVVFVGSAMTFIPHNYLSHYISTKAALEQLARCLSLDYVRDNIRFNALCPGPVRTEVFERVPKEELEAVLAQAPAKRLIEPDEVAKVLCWLMSDEANIVCGARITADLADGAGRRDD
jgi:NAD(P)-dependent dehydrogenase (short-subunit alcohol dehydrogenase family)